MLEATESIQTHFREEVLKMCKEIADLKLNLSNTEQELDDKMRALSAAEEALFLEKNATAQHHDALVHERAARGEAEAEASKLRQSLQQVRERCNALETLAAEHDSLREASRGEIAAYVEQIALARRDKEATAADTARLLETIKEREKTIDVLEQASAAREHDVMKLRKSLVWYTNARAKHTHSFSLTHTYVFIYTACRRNTIALSCRQNRGSWCWRRPLLNCTIKWSICLSTQEPVAPCAVLQGHRNLPTDMHACLE